MIWKGCHSEALVDSAQKSLNERLNQSQSTLRSEAAELSKARGKLEKLRDIKCQIESQESAIERTQSTLANLYNGLSADELQKKLEEAKYEATTESIKGGIVQAAMDLIDREGSEHISCPICDSHSDRQVLKTTLQRNANQSSNGISTGSVLA